jgi:hypothetical protein
MVLVVSTLSACAPSVSARKQLRAESPLDRARAVVTVAERGDLEAVHQLVVLLDDPDPAVRMFTIHALRRLCGRDFDYRYYEPEEKRAASVERWRQAIRDNELVAAKPDRNHDAGEKGGEPGAAASDVRANDTTQITTSSSGSGFP